jgi:murein DD-endopeptidase MepM/ murein hydrolase activator NlpD
VVYWKKQWQQPLNSYRITSVFGKKRVYDNGRVKYHRGTDFGGVIGTKVYAANDGIVRYSGKKKIRGNIVVIDNGSDIFSSYWHLNKSVVKKGDIVKRGEQIGELGTTGLATGPHLHWELRVGMVCVDGTEILSLPNEFFLR